MYIASLEAHTTLNTSIKRSPQHCTEGSNSQLFDHKNDAVTARPHERKIIILTQILFLFFLYSHDSSSFREILADGAGKNGSRYRGFFYEKLLVKLQRE